MVVSELALEITGRTEKQQHCCEEEEKETDTFSHAVQLSPFMGPRKEKSMKSSLLLSGIGNTTNLTMTELMLRNALHEIDHLELIEEDLLRRIRTMEKALRIIGEKTVCHRGTHRDTRYLNLGYIWEDDEKDFDTIMDLLDVEETTEEEEEE